MISVNYAINFRRLKNGSSSPFLWAYAIGYLISIDKWYLSNSLWKDLKINS